MISLILIKKKEKTIFCIFIIYLFIYIWIDLYLKEKKNIYLNI